MLESGGDLVPVIDTRTAKGMQDVYGGAYAAGCIYVPVDFAKKYPNTAQAVVNAMMRALRFIQTSTPDQIVAAVPPEYYTDKRAVQGGAREEHRDLQARRDRSRWKRAATCCATSRPSTRPCRTANVDVAKTINMTFAQKAAQKYR